jgi:hypothetical protein
MSDRDEVRGEGVGQGEFPGDRHGAGSAERGRDRNAGVGEGGIHEGADVPSESAIGGQQSASDALGEILDAIEARPPRRGPDDQTSDPDDVPPPRPDTPM